MTSQSLGFSIVRLLLIITALLLFNSPANSLTIRYDQGSYLLTPELSWHTDTSNKLTITDIVNNPTAIAFVANDKDTFNLSYEPDPVWFSLRLNRERVAGDANNQDSSWFLTFSYPTLELVDIYIVDDQGTINHQRTGQSIPANKRIIKSNNFIVPISIEAGQAVDIYIRVKTRGTIQLPLTLSNGEALLRDMAYANTLYGFYFGCMVIMALYNLFIFSAFRDKSYLLYVCYIVCLVLSQATLSGHSSTYLWPNSLLGTQHTIAVIIAFSCFFSTLFTRYFLSLKDHSPFLDKIVIKFCGLSVLSIPGLLLTPQSIAVQAAMGLSLLSIVIAITSGFVSLKNGLPTARYFLIGWVLLCIGGTLLALSSLGIIPVNFLTTNGARIGSLLEVLFLSMALADRFSFLKKENERIALESNRQLSAVNNELNATLNKLEHSNQLKDQFLNNISHELRTPMNGIEGSLALLNNKEINEQQGKYLEAAKTSARDMTSLIDSILRYSEVQSGSIQINNSAFEIREALIPLEVQYRSQCILKKLGFSWHIDKTVPVVIDADCEQIKMVLKQLIENAIKFTSKGQIQVNITTNCEQTTAQKMLCLSVIDSGIGIDPEHLDSVCKAFQQLDGNSNRSFGGLGIGLTLCHQLASIMDGKLHVQSTLDGGTEVSFSIPLVNGDESFLDKKQPTPLSEQQKTILIAEDNPVNQMVIKGFLKPFNCIILTANNGEEVSEVLQSQPVDLILMDCQMPDVDGFEATRRIRNSATVYSNIPIIAVTANALTTDSNLCLEAGMNDYIKKPVNRQEIEQKVQRWLNSGKSVAV